MKLRGGARENEEDDRMRVDNNTIINNRVSFRAFNPCDMVKQRQRPPKSLETGLLRS